MTQQNNEAFKKWWKSMARKIIPMNDSKSFSEVIAKTAWQAATAESNKCIAKLKAVVELNHALMQVDDKAILELQAHINVLREALGNIHQWYDGYSEHHINVPTVLREIDNIATETLASTPALKGK